MENIEQNNILCDSKKIEENHVLQIHQNECGPGYRPQLQSVSPEPGSSLFSICSIAVYQFFSRIIFLSSPDIPENLKDFFRVFRS